MTELTADSLCSLSVHPCARPTIPYPLPFCRMAPLSKKELPSKEKSLFRELLNHYETRQLKKGVKTADQILKKFPDNGGTSALSHSDAVHSNLQLHKETLCMKGLILTHMGKREEGIDLVKKGIRLDLTSHIVWHVFGLIQKGEKNYEEALKSYTQALKFDKVCSPLKTCVTGLTRYRRTSICYKMLHTFRHISVYTTLCKIHERLC